MNDRPVAAALLAAAITVVAAPTAKAAAPVRLASDADRDAELRALRAQVEALTARLNAQEAAQRDLERQAEAARAEAAATRSAVLQVAEPPPAPPTAVAAAEPPATSLSGRMYYDISRISQKRDGVRQPPSGVGFDIKRMFVGVNHRFDDTFSAYVMTDFTYAANDGTTQVILKNAFLQMRVSDALTVRLGAADLPWVPFMEGLYGYRFVEPTVTDRTGFANAEDWGVHVSGDLAGGHLSYAVSVVDGGNFTRPLRSESVDVEGRLSAQLRGFTVAVGGYRGKLGQNTAAVTTRHTAQRLDLVAAYASDRFRVGVQYFDARNWSNVSLPAADRSRGYALFGSYNLNQQVSVFGRYDWVKPNRITNPRLDDEYFNLGVNYRPIDIVDFALVYKRDEARNGLIPTANGVIGGARRGVFEEIGLFGQVRY